MLQSWAAARERFLDGLDGCGPDKRFRVFVPGLEKVFNGLLQIGDAEKDAAADCLVVQVTEPSLNQIHPTGTGRYEVRHKPGMTFQPFPYFLVFVGAVVVHDQMQRDVARKLAVEPAQEFEKLLMTVSLMAFADDLTL